ncbi:RNA polymerase sigma factor [Streptomyces sp. NPDC053427]|uniref:RNA polymerase sigma factor n=1 Tax=Streptomyces sp. NPDC053427 TaxID=3365701 RepID=UPI0037D96B4C
MSHTQHSSDGQVAQEVNQRDMMRAFYLAQHPRLWRFVVRRVPDHGDAEDVCQEIWRMFFVRYDHYVTFYEKPEIALYRSARCRIADYWRRRGTAELTDPHDVDALAGAVTLDSLGITERRIDLQRALSWLPARQREAMGLHYLDQLSVAETASLMGVSADGVKKLVQRALATLRTTRSLETYQPPVGGGTR